MLKKGDNAPFFDLVDSTGKNVSLDDFKGKWLVLFFYPKDNTPGCTIEAHEFSEALEEFSEAGVEVFGINGDSVESHQNFCMKKKLQVRLLSDTEKTVLQAYKVWGEKLFMGTLYAGLTRSTFIINPDGLIEEAMYNIKIKGHVSRVLKMVKQFVKGSK